MTIDPIDDAGGVEDVAVGFPSDRAMVKPSTIAGHRWRTSPVRGEIMDTDKENGDTGKWLKRNSWA